MDTHSAIPSNILRIDPEVVAHEIESAIRRIVFQQLRRKGAVVGLSGGIDSSVVAALCVRALGSDRVLGLLMPETESSGESLRLGQLQVDELGIEAVLEDITPVLSAAGCYQRRDEAIRTLIPQYDVDWKSKIVLPPLNDNGGYNIFSIIVQSPSGEQIRSRLTPQAYHDIVAAMNFKQRVRIMMDYYHADRLRFAVVGTPNRLEYDQGFFVKNGDGAADLKPIAHLYKTQVYQLAKFLGIPDEIQQRSPTTDTYSLEQSQEEFFFSIPYDKMDLCLYGKNHGMSAVTIAEMAGLTPDQVEHVYRDIDSKRNATRYLHLKPQLVEEIEEVSS